MRERLFIRPSSLPPSSLPHHQVTSHLTGHKKNQKLTYRLCFHDPKYRTLLQLAGLGLGKEFINEIPFILLSISICRQNLLSIDIVVSLKMDTILLPHSHPRMIISWVPSHVCSIVPHRNFCSPIWQDYRTDGRTIKVIFRGHLAPKKHVWDWMEFWWNLWDR